MRVVGDIAAGACALLFLGAVLGKLDSWSQWERLTGDFPGPVGAGRVVRVLLPVIEGSIVLLSLAFPRIGLAIGIAVLLCLAGGAWHLTKKLQGRECNCFGVIAPTRITPRLALRNAALAVLLAGGWYTAQHDKLQTLSLSAVLATLLCGGIVLMLLQSHRLIATVRTVGQGEEIG
jgi:hypothetical protein